MRELPDAPSLEVRISPTEIKRHNRWSAGFFQPRYRHNEGALRKLHSVRGLNIEYEPIRQRGQPAFLEWKELLAEAGQPGPSTVVSPKQELLLADVASQFFTDLFGAIDRAAVLRDRDDEKIILAFLYLVRRRRAKRHHKVVLVELYEKWRDADGLERVTDLFGELETAVSHHLDL